MTGEKTAAGRLARLGRLYRRFAPLLRPHRGRLLLAGLFMLGSIVTGLLAPWPVQIVLDGVVLGQRGRGLLAWVQGFLPEERAAVLSFGCLALVVLTALRGLFSYGQRLLTAAAGHRVVSDLRLAVFIRLERLSLGFHGRRPSGDLLVRMTGDVSLLREVLVPAVLDALSRLLVLVGIVSLMAWMDAGLTLVAVAMMPLLALATVRFGRRIRAVAREQRRKEGRLASLASEVLASIAIVQAYSREDEMAARISRQNARSLRAGLKSARLEESLARLVDLTLAAGSAAVLWVGARRALSGALSPGELVVFLAYLRGIYRPVESLVRTASRASKAVACGERIVEVLDSREEVVESPDAIEPPESAGEIVFENVTFGYDPTRPVLEEVSFRIGAGEKVGLVGPSGAGKSTLAALLLRLYDPQRGRILVGGRDLREFRIESWRRKVAVVLQDPFLFSISVEENIRIGRPSASREEVVEAARAAGAHEFIEALPDRYETVLGERGGSLSRGQQQRIALARAVLRDAPVLVFDEPTTGLDPATEAEVLETLERVGRGRTVLWIAHDLPQILGCPRVLVLRGGRLVEDGSPRLLLERPSAFQGLVLGGPR